MICFPNAKINIGLEIVSKREDGFHNIVSGIYPIKYCDILEISESGKFKFTYTGLNIPGNGKDNLIVQAYHLLKEENDIPAVEIHLHKVVPIGAGLGGGSSDATFTLITLNQLFDLNYNLNELEKFAGSLGADCPFFVRNKPGIVFEKGNIFKLVEFDVSGYWLVVVTPAIYISTHEAYSYTKPSHGKSEWIKFLSQPPEIWNANISNSFEDNILTKYPELEKIKAKLIIEGAIYSSLSGSGSSVYGLFKERIDLNNKFPASYTLWNGKL